LNPRKKFEPYQSSLHGIYVYVVCSTQQQNDIAPLMQAVVSNSLTLVEKCLTSDPLLDLNAKGADGNTVLTVAAFRGSLPIVKTLVSYGADVNTCTSV
jgi:ankyrin repeat protein